MKPLYLETIALIERLHRHCLEVIKTELDRLGIRDLNSVQAMILFNIGESELTVGELTQRGYYQGSNVSYNVKKLVENGYLIQERSLHDRRSFHVRASEKGLAIVKQMHQLYDQHVTKLEGTGFAPATLEETARTLRKLEQFWAAAQQLGGRLAA